MLKTLPILVACCGLLLACKDEASGDRSSLDAGGMELDAALSPDPDGAVSADGAVPQDADATCEPGFEKVSGACVDIDECLLDTHTCDRDPITSCVNSAGSFECGPCPSGFAGAAKDGSQGCVPVLNSLVVSAGMLTPAFDPILTVYTLELPLWVDSLEVTALADAALTLTLGGASATSGQGVAKALTLGSNVLEVTVAAGGAERSYVLTVTRGELAEHYIKAANADQADRFGIAVALSSDGSTMAVGASGESSATTTVNSTPNEDADGAGAVYVFIRQGGASGNWSQQAYIKAENAGAGDGFGNSVALSADGTTLAVGAPGEDSASNSINGTPNEDALGAGAAYVFTRIGGSFSQQAYVKAANAGAGDGFGSSVALSADGATLAVGATGEDSASNAINSTPNEGADGAGAAYVFARASGASAAWTQQAYIKAANAGAGDTFGAAVALSGDGTTLAVGARNEDSASNTVNSTPNEGATDAGAAYVFSRADGAGGTWAQQAYCKASNAGEGDRFGISVALSGDGATLAVGATGEDSLSNTVNSTPNEGATDAGAAYVFTRTSGVAGGWTQEAYVKASDAAAGAQFGHSLALPRTGATLGIGAVLARDQANKDTGRAYVFSRAFGVGGGWAQRANPAAFNANGGDLFGDVVALSGDAATLAVGARFEDSASTGVGSTPNEDATQAGAVYVYQP